ncbi:putative sulfate exporter family transporter [Olleya aquimaris]|nr:putative sulfate exporter family transporter [Olleya aquimaris]
MKSKLSKILYLVIVITIALGYINSTSALLLGFGFTLLFDNPFKTYSHKVISYLLKLSIIGLGFGMLFKDTLQTTKQGFGLTVFSIVLTVTFGVLLAKALKMDLKLGHLITSGTSICGGSAIAAISPIIKAKSSVISIALGIVFLLNSVALFVFPALGHAFNLTQEQFGLWCAIAIHDTSSVVGAALTYGDQALKIATTVKLSRTLWIIPLSIFTMFYFKTKGEKIKIPYFIILFIIAIIINSYQLLPQNITLSIVTIAKRLLVLTLLVVGSTLYIKDLKALGSKPVLLAVSLWIFISVFSLMYILN